VSADLFHEATAFLGGRLDSAVLPAGTATYLARLRAGAEELIGAVRSNHPRLPPIYFDFIAANEVNACAFAHKGWHFIGVTAGAVLGMRLLFGRMLSDRRILPEIGDPRNDVEHPRLGQPVLPALLEASLKNGTTPPRDPVRLDYCEFLSVAAFAVLLFHELTHIRNGHVDYRARRAPFLAELGNAPVGPDEAITLQAMENDADTGAAWFGTDLVYLWANRLRPRNPHLQTYEAILGGMLFAVFSFFRVFTDVPLAGTDLCGYTHPPFRFRIGTFLETMKYCVEVRHGISEDALPLEVARATAMTEKAFHFLTGEPVASPTRTDRWRYTEWWWPVGREHKARLRKRWEGGLRKELESHGYAPPMIYS